MAAVTPNPDHIRDFASEQAFEAWLAAHHGTASELWLKIHKKTSGLPTVTYAQALDVAWDICRDSGELDTRSIDATKAALTRSILTNYQNGERNTRRLAIVAVAQLDARPLSSGNPPAAA